MDIRSQKAYEPRLYVVTADTTQTSHPNQQLLDKRISWWGFLAKHLRGVGPSLKPELYTYPNFRENEEILQNAFVRWSLNFTVCHCFFLLPLWHHHLYRIAPGVLSYIVFQSMPRAHCDTFLFVYNFLIMWKYITNILLCNSPKAQAKHLSIQALSRKSSCATFWKCSLIICMEGRWAACFLSEVTYSVICNKTGIKSLVPV